MSGAVASRSVGDIPPELTVHAHAPEDVVELARCVVLSRSSLAGSVEPSGHDKTMLFFALDKEDGKHKLVDQIVADDKDS